MIISDLQPDLVIEIGTNMGGGALYIADLMNNIGHGQIHTIDIIAQSDPILKSHKRINYLPGGGRTMTLKKLLDMKKSWL